MKEYTCTTYIVKFNLGSKESWVIQSNQDVHVWMYGIYMVANLILLCSLKTYLFFWIWKHNLARKHELSYSSLSFFFFSSGHLSTHYFRYHRDLSIFHYSFFFMNNFCIAQCFFSAIKLLRDSNKKFGAFIWGISYRVYFWCSLLV